MIIDFHSHFVPSSYPPRPADINEPNWPSMKPSAIGAEMYVGDRLFRNFEDFYWDIPGRIAVMDEAGVDLQVISPLPELLSYWLDPKATVVLTNFMNDVGAKMVAEGKGRLKALGIVALNNLPLALEQVEGLAKTGHIGVFVGSHVNGKSIASEEFHPFFAACERLGLLVFCHGFRPSGLERLGGPGLMHAVVGVPHENTMAIASFIVTDILGKFPNLKLVFSHGGGGISAVIDRMTLVWNMFPQMREQLKEPPNEYARRFYYDTAVFGSDYLGYLVKQFGADRILAGTDGPTEIGERDIKGFVARAGISPADVDKVVGGNAEALLASLKARGKTPA